MFLKVLAIFIAIFFVYILFFKKGRESIVNKKEEKIEDEMVECPSCQTYVSKKEAILSNGKFFCSKECLLSK